MISGQRSPGCLVWKRGAWSGAGMAGGEKVAWSTLQPLMLEEFSFGQGIDLLCDVSKEGPKTKIGN